MSEVLNVPAYVRVKSTKANVRAERKAGKIPAVIYTKHETSTLVSVDAKEINKRYYKGNFFSQIMNLNIDSQNIRVLPYQIQTHPVTDNIEHLDFIRIDANTKVKVHIPIHVLNQDKALGVKRGGIVNIIKREIEVYCSPENIPAFIEIDIIDLNIAHSVHLDDIKLPENVEPVIHENMTFVSISGRTDDGANEEKK